MATGLWWSQLSITTFSHRAAVSSSFGRLLLPPSCYQVGRAATKRLLVSRRETAFGTRPSWGSRPAPWSRWAVTVSCERKASSRCDTGSRMPQTVVFVTGNSKKLEVCTSPCHDHHACHVHSVAKFWSLRVNLAQVALTQTKERASLVIVVCSA